MEENHTTHTYATFWQRGIARILDTLLLLVPFICTLALYDSGNQNPSILNALSQTAYLLIYTVFWTFYEIIMLVEYKGQTFGKRVMKIKVISQNNSPLTYGNAFIRTLITETSLYVFGLGLLWVIWDKKKQSWHDKIAQTLVVKT